jgi:D-alanyl-D-alanine carboxypeptidase/D-alanyl-D-alanine-endopeptidase (penicillin-binding protein 4)
MQRFVAIFFYLSVMVCFVQGATVSAQKSVQDYLFSKIYTNKGIAVVIKDVENDSVIVSINGDEMLNPASVSKLVTGAAAFEILGTNHQFKTNVYIDGPFNSDSGVVNGNLYIQGGGDPGFTAERLWLLAQHLYHLGIRSIRGNLIMDDYFFDSVTVGPGFDEDSSSRAYQSLISALSANFNTLAIHHRSGATVGSPVQIDVFPKIKGLNVVSTAKTGDLGKTGNIDIQTVASSNGTDVIVRGNRALGESPKYVYRKVWQTWETFGGAMLSLFDDNNISVTGKLMHRSVPDTLAKSKPFYEFQSEPISQFVNSMFKYSSNFAAEMVFKSLTSPQKQPCSWNRSATIVQDWWVKCGLPGQLQLRNGSGMGDVNRISAGQITALLSHIWKQKAYLPEYLHALSISGIDGTLKDRFKKSVLKGIIRAKTGTLNSISVSTLSGYLLAPDKTYAFTILCNRVGKGQYDNWTVQEGVLEKFSTAVGIK